MLAHQGGWSLRHARDLAERLRTERLEREHALGGRIQESILQSRPNHRNDGLEVAAASKPCRQVGGDFFETLEVGNGRLDVVLGDGAHADPAAGLAPVVREIRAHRPDLEVVAVVVGSPEDPQDPEVQAEQLRDAGARVFTGLGPALDTILGRHLRAAGGGPSSLGVDPAALEAPFSAINVGLESFTDSLAEQEIDVLQVDWRPPAGGDRRLLEILDRLRVPAPVSGNETESRSP